MRRALAIGGPTATGKTALAVAVAHRVDGELVNADSRQAARRLRVGTATPTAAELAGVRCHLTDVVEPGEALTPPAWRQRALAVLDDLAVRAVPAILVGGTGQYLRALHEGWTFAGGAPEPGERAALTAQASTPDGLAELAAEVRARDPAGAAGIDLANPRRVIRAVELLRGGAASLASARGRGDAVEVDLVVLDADPALHRRTVEERARRMFDDGELIDEVTAELARGTSPDALRRAGIGYPEALGVVEGALSRDDARAETVRRTLRYAKAQRTWFRAEPARLRLVRSAGDSLDTLADAVLTAASA